MRSVLFVIVILILISCKHNDKRNDNFGENGIYSIVMNNDSTGVITLPCAVMISPTIEIIDSLKKSDSDGFYVCADDNGYYDYEARKFLDSLKTKIIEKESKGLLLFKTRSGQNFKMKLDSLSWGIILFNGKTKPISIGVLDIENEYNAYMKK